MQVPAQRRNETRLLGIALAHLIFFSAVTTGEQTETPQQGSYTIGAGDVLNIVVWENQQLTMTIPVRPDGFISLPLVNDVKAAGLTPMQLQTVLAGKLGDYVSSPVISVIVTEVHSFQVSILGKVRSPGRYELRGPTTVLDIIAMAGGLDDFSAQDDIYVLRPMPEMYQSIPFKYSTAISPSGKAVNIELQPGDFIIVP